jgi:hypothetical protein
MDSFDQVEALARKLAAESGADFDAPNVKRAHWRGKARDLLSEEAGFAALGRGEFFAGWVLGVCSGSLPLVIGYALWGSLHG